MTSYTYTVTVTCDTEDQAEQVMSERLGHDEDYGFPYILSIANNGPRKATASKPPPTASNPPTPTLDGET